MPVGHYSYDATVTFPNRGWQAVAYACFCLCLVVNSGILARRIEQYKRSFVSFRPLDSFWLCDIFALLTYLMSFLFIVVNGVLTFAVGTGLPSTCDASVTICVSAFVIGKVVLYLFYMERLFLVSWAKNAGNSSPPPFMARIRCMPWLVGAGIFVFGVPCAILLGFSREWQLLYREDMSAPVGCHVFLRWTLATPIIIWCAIINGYIMGALLWAVKKGQVAHSGLRTVCVGSSWALLISGLSTVINLSTLLILKGEHGIECLLCCSIDVVVNSLALAIVTSNKGEAATFPSLSSRAYGSSYEAEHDDPSSVDLTPALIKRPSVGDERHASEYEKKPVQV